MPDPRRKAKDPPDEPNHTNDRSRHHLTLPNMVAETTRKCPYKWNSPLSKLRVCRVFGLFWPIFDSNCGGNILDVDIAPAI